MPKRKRSHALLSPRIQHHPFRLRCFCACCTCVVRAVHMAASGYYANHALPLQQGLPTLQLSGFSLSLACSTSGSQPVLRSLCARSPGCGCFCLRLDFQVTVSVRGSQGPGFLVLAFSARTLKSSGVPARRVQAGGASAWACCLWFVAFVRSLLSGCVCFWCLCAGRIYSSEGLCRRASQS